MVDRLPSGRPKYVLTAVYHEGSSGDRFEIKTAVQLIKSRLDERAWQRLEGLTGMQGWIISMFYHREQAGVDGLPARSGKGIWNPPFKRHRPDKLMEQNELIPARRSP
jgi:hypothetical protein